MGCLGVLDEGGLLAFSTNAAKLSMGDVEKSLAEAGARMDRPVQVIGRATLPPDFPVAPGFPEGNYLKFLLVSAS